MKKWLITLCCVLVAAAIAIVTILNNSNSRIDTLNKDLGDVQAEYNALKEKNEKDEQTIQNLNQQVSDLTAEKDQLTAENGQLNETLEGLNRNLTASQQKLMGVMYILTDGAQGNIESVLSPYIKIFSDVGLDNPYFDAVDYVNEHQLMAPASEEAFGVSEQATLGEFAESLYLLQGKTGTREEAVNALLETEKRWLSANAAEEAAEPAAEEAAEVAAEAPAAEEAAEEAAEASAAEEASEASAVEEITEDEHTVLTKDRILAFCSAYCAENGKKLPEIIFPVSETAEAVRGDLAIALQKLAQAENE